MPEYLDTDQDLDLSRLDYADLGYEQRAWVLRRAMERGRVERSLAMWRMMAALAAGFRKVMAMVAVWYAAYRWRRRRRSGAAALYALSDYMLKDIGVARCEIERLIATDWRRAA